MDIVIPTIDRFIKNHNKIREPLSDSLYNVTCSVLRLVLEGSLSNPSECIQHTIAFAFNNFKYGLATPLSFLQVFG